MCGIVGIVNFDLGCSVSGDVVRTMTSSLHHRGPDDEGIFVDGNVGLGHRRLSIIDLAGGHQPMCNHNGNLHIVFNGEIYNFPDLKADLEVRGHRFRTRSDTETILHCYEEFGERCVEKLNGMFAFAIWNKKERALFLARDRVGKKPLYYYTDSRRFVFASEIKAILTLSDIDQDLDVRAIDRFFSFAYIPEPRTIFRSIQQVPAAHTLSLDNARFRTARYWDLTAEGDGQVKGEGEYVEEVRGLLEDAVRIRLISDVPVGVFLSGGVDSSAITGLMACASDGPVKTFSISGGEGEFDELPYAREVVRHYGTEHWEYAVGHQRLEEILPFLIGHFDQPFGDSSMIPTYEVSRMAREHVTVALSGEGGDELFAGYTWHKRFMFVEQYWKKLPVPVRSVILPHILPDPTVPALHRNRLVRTLYRISLANKLSLSSDADMYQALVTAFSEDFKSRIFSGGIKEVLSVLDKAQLEPMEASSAFMARQSVDLLNKALYSDLQVYLPGDLLTKVDRMSMANSLEVRSPLLDYRLIELAARIPASFKLRGTTSKYILRQAMGPILPAAINKRKTKRGFSVPVSQWLRQDLREFAREVLSDRSWDAAAFFDFNAIEAVLNDHQNGYRDYGTQLWSLLMFALWTENRKALHS